MTRRTKRICSKCGKIIYGGQDKILCTECGEQSKKETRMERVCMNCGTAFWGYPKTKRCASCEIEAEKERSRKYRKEGYQRHIGSIDKCERCGKEYIVKSGLQKYCSDACSRLSLLEWQREHKKETRDKRKVADNHMRTRAKRKKVCKYCLQPFWSDNSSNLCSDYCRKKQKQLNQCAADICRGRKRCYEKYIEEREAYRIETENSLQAK